MRLEGPRDLQIDPAEKLCASLAVWRAWGWDSNSTVVTLSAANRSTVLLRFIVVRHVLDPTSPHGAGSDRALCGPSLTAQLETLTYFTVASIRYRLLLVPERHEQPIGARSRTENTCPTQSSLNE